MNLPIAPLSPVALPAWGWTWKPSDALDALQVGATMATKRRPINRRRRALTECELAVLTDGDHIDRFFMTDDEIADLWADHGAEITAQWAAENPGTRPSLWWRYDAPRWNPPARHAGWYYVPEMPEPRQRL